ncbi:hypothetical protein [Acetobacter fallax]|uniref:Uncharacterized protein n=1 Tax=Acetobacter fallax TaxID=1737473 RepID=A0ABX0KFZ3_9PROT|nr:hypothetical protein [Acetobacter fallax]NHO33345.1 hypothetical protein [Acetobacter fallax]NHO36966.1 hypothetical protein [Acetobacter fallax]
MVHGFLPFWTQFHEPIEFASGVLSGWWGYLLRSRKVARQKRYETGQLALRLVSASEEQIVRLNDLLLSYADEIDGLRQGRWLLLDCLADIQAQALAARLIVHELDDRLGLPPRQFTPLPPYPPDLRTGAQAADTAQPRADTRPINRPATSAEAESV